MVAKVDKDEKVLAAAGGFTGLWALTWLGTSMMAAGSVAQGAFGVGAVMSGSGLTALWWKTRTVGRYHDAAAEAESETPVNAESQKG